MQSPLGIIRSAGVFAFIGALIFTTQTASPQADRTVYWLGAESCDDVFETPVSSMPGGSKLTKIHHGPSIQAHYALSNGGTLRVSVRDIQKKYVQGRNFAEAFDNVFKQRPLQNQLERITEKYVVLADVRSMFGLVTPIRQNADTSEYYFVPNRLFLTVSSRIRIVEWDGYDQATPEDQILWDRFQCQSYHHELGHILISAQIFEESEPEWMMLRAQTKDELLDKREALFEEVSDRAAARQKIYHQTLDAWGPEMAKSKPYLELPFPWLLPETASTPPTEIIALTDEPRADE